MKLREHCVGELKSTDFRLLLFSGLLHKEPGFRLGCRRVNNLEYGAEELKAHPFFMQGDSNTGREPIPWKKMETAKVSYKVINWWINEYSRKIPIKRLFQNLGSFFVQIYLKPKNLFIIFYSSLP